MGVIHGMAAPNTPVPIAVDSTGKIQVEISAEGLALDVSVDGLEGGIGTAADAATTTTAAGSLSAQIRQLKNMIYTGVGCSASATFTPAAASHVANDCNGAAAEFALAAPSACRFMVTDAELEIDGGTAEATAWRLYLYNVTPPSATADDGAWDLPSGDRASFLGYVDLGTAVDLGSTQWVQTTGINKTVKLSGTSVFGYLVNLTTLTPAAVAHIVKIYGTPV